MWIAPQRQPDGRADEHGDDEAERDAEQRGADVAPQLAGARLAHHHLDDGARARQIAALRDDGRKLPKRDERQQ